ncbi:MAG: TatD family hydrolase, partial [Candidatus Parcubacteria bacterium]|nr:TatD family hydrolase [Candidatus Parcubacteria bacterium]
DIKKSQFSNPNFQTQKDLFIKQIELAKELDKPLMIHCRNAHKEVIEIIKKSKHYGNIHFFSGTWQEARQYFDLGFTVSFTGVITFTHDYDEIVKKSPLDKIMIETDAPFVAPVPFRGKRNEPVYVKYVAERIAEIRGEQYKKIAQATTENALRFFKLA